MKVLFAVSNDNITTSVVNKYQQKYKEIVTTKSVYYFNAIVNELKRDKEYNAIVIEEDLEPISNNNYEKIDKFLLEKLDNISDEASRPTGEDIPIILICADRRTKSDQLLRQLFSMSIYNALVGNDRSLDKVCDLMKKPRNKKDAKLYYEIETDQAEYEPHKDEIVSEEQIQSILNYYKKIGTNEKKCVQAFDRISKQYDNTQLRIIVKFLPIDVKAILEAYSPVYQKLMSNGTVLSNGKYNEYKRSNPKKPQKLDFITKDVSGQATTLSKPVVIPSNMNRTTVIESNSEENEKNQNTMNSKPQTSQPQNLNQQQVAQQNYNSQQMPQQNYNQQPMQQPNYGYQPMPQQNYNYQQPQYNNMMGGQPYNPYGGQPYNPYASQMPYGNMNNQSPYYANMQQPYNPYINNSQGQMNNSNTSQNDLTNNQSNASQNDFTNNHENIQAYNNQIVEQNNSVSENIEQKETKNDIIPTYEEKIKNSDINQIPDIMDEIAPITPMKSMQDEQTFNETKDEKTENKQVDTTENNNDNNIDESAVVEPVPVKRRRGRPRKIKPEEEIKTIDASMTNDGTSESIVEPLPVKRRRGRPRKNRPEDEATVNTEQQISNLPAKQENKSILVQQDTIPENTHIQQEPVVESAPIQQEPIVESAPVQQDPIVQSAPVQQATMIENTSAQNDDVLLKNISKPVNEEVKNNSNINLYDLDINDEDNISQPDELISDIKQPKQQAENQIYNSNIANNKPIAESTQQNNSFMGIDEDAPYLPMTNEIFGNNPYENQVDQNQFRQTSMINTRNNPEPIQNTPITGNGKLVAFVGTSKNGTSFVVNSIAQLLSESGVNTAVVDLTKNKNSYYLFTDNDDTKIKTATESLKQLSSGQVNGLVVKNNLTIFTALPGDSTMEQINNENVIRSLSNRFEVVLLDCDYKTDYTYFENANEIYLIQSMDAFTIQPLTKFLSELKAKNILDEDKLRIVINKHIKLRKLNAKMIVGGMSTYNEPSMTLQRELFNPKKVQTITIPFDDQTYIRYLEAIAMCELTLNGYSKDVLESLEKLKNMVYPLIAGANRMPSNNINYNDTFNMNNNMGYQNQITSQGFTNNMNDTLNRMRNNNY